MLCTSESLPSAINVLQKPKTLGELSGTELIANFCKDTVGADTYTAENPNTAKL